MMMMKKKKTALTSLMLLSLATSEAMFTLERAHGKKMDFEEKQQLDSEETSTSRASLLVPLTVNSERFIERQFGQQLQQQQPKAETTKAVDEANFTFPTGVTDAKLDQIQSQTTSTTSQANNANDKTGLAKTRPRWRQHRRQKKRKGSSLTFQDLPEWKKVGVTRPGHQGRRDVADHGLWEPRDASAWNSLAQTFEYPDSNSLTQTDRDYYRMVRTENGFSDFFSSHPAKSASIKKSNFPPGEMQKKKKNNLKKELQAKPKKEKKDGTTRPRFAYHAIQVQGKDEQEVRRVMAISLDPDA